MGWFNSITEWGMENIISLKTCVKESMRSHAVIIVAWLQGVKEPFKKNRLKKIDEKFKIA